MSRVGKKPIIVPDKVKAELKGLELNVQGPKGKLMLSLHPRMKVQISDKEILVNRPTDIRTDRALHGLTRNLIANMVNGVVNGFQKDLIIEGVGFKAQVKGKELSLALGYTHPIDYPIPEGIEIKCATPTQISILGIDKQKVGQAAADIRRFHKPEPYKGKGIRYSDEVVRRKQGKAVG
ncbi:MAG: 50S ribosomal protein L6 [Omnitrophica bacterium GWA2_52_8]|nr:MAG: 50S ribosomal protein L6 [Omnitrophica bacterium GWA2_52_8]